MASPVSALTGSSNSGAAASSTTGATGTSSGASQEVFLQLLVSQLKNQDPLNPTDSTQFVSELAQFTQLEQVMGIRGDIESYHAQAVVQAAATAAGQTNTTSPAPTTGQTQP